MSWLSKLTGINIDLRKTLTTDAGQVIVKGIESTSPVAAEVGNLATAIAANPPTNVVSAIATTGHVIAVFDPNAFNQAEAGLNALFAHLGLSIAEPLADDGLAALLAPLGLVAVKTGAPVSTGTQTV